MTDPLDATGYPIRVGDYVAFAGLSGSSAVIRIGVVKWFTPSMNVGVRMDGGTLVKRNPHTLAVVKGGDGR